MTSTALSFLRAESGAITVDWVVLSALTAAFGLFVLIALNSGVHSVANNVETEFNSMEVAALQTLGVSD